MSLTKFGDWVKKGRGRGVHKIRGISTRAHLTRLATYNDDNNRPCVLRWFRSYTEEQGTHTHVCQAGPAGRARERERRRRRRRAGGSSTGRERWLCTNTVTRDGGRRRHARIGPRRDRVGKRQPMQLPPRTARQTGSALERGNNQRGPQGKGTQDAPSWWGVFHCCFRCSRCRAEPTAVAAARLNFQSCHYIENQFHRVLCYMRVSFQLQRIEESVSPEVPSSALFFFHTSSLLSIQTQLSIFLNREKLFTDNEGNISCHDNKRKKFFSSCKGREKIL